jgi:hypothetical protein
LCVLRNMSLASMVPVKLAIDIYRPAERGRRQTNLAGSNNKYVHQRRGPTFALILESSGLITWSNTVCGHNR